MEAPETRYTLSGEVNIAYQVVGEGPLDLVFIPSLTHHVELVWENPPQAWFYSRIASVSRLLLFDKRGTGMSDRFVGAPTLEVRMDDIRAVMDAADSERAVLVGLGEGGPLCALFAATYPERTTALVLINSGPRAVRSPELPWLPTRVERERQFDELVRHWGDREAAAERFGGNHRVRRRRNDGALYESSDSASVLARRLPTSGRTWTWTSATCFP
jgi:pimeloyl-ACP methyl ester carboxylesterase